MREIKFRAWDKDYSRMHVCGDDVHDSISFINSIACYYNLQNGCGSMPDGSGTYELMQCTGLKDRNGKEIYEGDIVNAINRIHEFESSINVHYLNGCFMFGNWNAHEYFNRHQFIEVIGNIYENPELLEKEKTAQ